MLLSDQVGHMRIIGIILIVFSCIGMAGGFIYGNLNIGGYSYELSLALAWGWWSSALGLLALAGICFAVPNFSEYLADISKNIKRTTELLEKLSIQKMTFAGDDAIDSLYANPSVHKQDDPRFPRFKNELDYDYWERVKNATLNK